MSSDQPAAKSFTIDRNFVLICVAAAALAFYVGKSGFDPIHPFTPAKRERPVLQFLARVAKLGLWVLVCADPPPDQPQTYAHHRSHDGNLCHSEGW